MRVRRARRFDHWHRYFAGYFHVAILATAMLVGEASILATLIALLPFKYLDRRSILIVIQFIQRPPVLQPNRIKVAMRTGRVFLFYFLEAVACILLAVLAFYRWLNPTGALYYRIERQGLNSAMMARFTGMFSRDLPCYCSLRRCLFANFIPALRA
ncbi:hypothetical protein DCS_01993 [Drechmeria coniospora]|uniref:Uncharacterized protein n=1 Tax=Drechmeria coniospora TaxID=98403 RepID=A0A151GUS5_DRECN|nr:hypothetical protein DCS_01993 [Drechmeria coniospora]KYK60855.1 hypothetical protein DCS_01993 [Drechmeria coniospora]